MIWRWPDSDFAYQRGWQLATPGEDIPSLAEVVEVVPASALTELRRQKDEWEVERENWRTEAQYQADRAVEAESHVATYREALEEAATNEDYAADIARRALGASIPHDVGIDCLEGGHKGYQAVCWECGWRGPEHLRGDEEMGTPESRSHKNQAREEAAKHRRESRALSQPTPQPSSDVILGSGDRET